MKTFRVKNDKIQNHLTVGMPKPLTYKPMALYSLFLKVDGKWKRVSDAAYSEKLAYRVFAERYSKAPLSYQIRPVAIAPNRAEGKSKFRRPHLSFEEKLHQSNWEYSPK